MTLLIVTLGGDLPRRSFHSACGLLLAWSRSSSLRHKHTENNWAPTPCKWTWESEDGKEMKASTTLVMGTGQSHSHFPEHSTLETAARLRRNALWCAPFTSQCSSLWRTRSVSMRALVEECSSNSEPSSTSRTDYCWQLSTVETKLKMQQSCRSCIVLSACSPKIINSYMLKKPSTLPQIIMSEFEGRKCKRLECKEIELYINHCFVLIILTQRHTHLLLTQVKH